MENDLKNALTVEKLREHLTYREENAELHKTFKTIRKVSTGTFGCTICIDDDQKLWYLKGFGNDPIFKFSELSYYTLKEDNGTIETGNRDGVDMYTSIIGTVDMGGTDQTLRNLSNKLDRLNNKVNGGTTHNTYNSNQTEQRLEAPVTALNLEIGVDNV